MKHIGFIGLGIMGKPMALNLLRAGYALHVYGRKATTMQPLIDAGAIGYTSPAELAPHANIIFTMVKASADVEEVLLGKHGLITTAKPGTIVIDMSTIAAATAIRAANLLAKQQIEMLDAPVSGGEQGAIAGNLSIMVGGKVATLERAKSVLEILGSNIIHIGDHGAGQIAKACNQIIVAETIIAVSEALSLAQASGVDASKVRDALLGGFASSRILEIHGKRMLEKDYQPGFKAGLHQKDIRLALEQANNTGIKLPAAEYAMHCLDRLVAKGHSELDSAAMHILEK